MNFSSDVFGRFRRFTGGKSRNLPKADGGKGIVRRVDELCGIALRKRRFNEAVGWAQVVELQTAQGGESVPGRAAKMNQEDLDQD